MRNEFKYHTYKELIEECKKVGVSAIIGDEYYDGDGEEFDPYGDDGEDCLFD